MSKLHIRWLEESLQEGPKTASQIMFEMSHRRSCPTMYQIGNYLAKWPQFQALTQIRQEYMTGNRATVTLWKLKN